MVNVEVDVLVGPLLAAEARAAGVVYTMAYGDQPGLTCELVEWARSCGFAGADLEAGVIDREVVHHMRDNGYDLRHYLEENWSRIGPDLVGKIRIYNPEMDQFYLPYAVYLLEEFLEGTTDPHYGGEIIHGRPMKGHGWSPFTNADLIRRMADHIAANAPAGASRAWHTGSDVRVSTP